ncbi:MAG: hypothetical protein WAN11_24050 [Syntrophobacteraceae bacterium]
MAHEPEVLRVMDTLRVSDRQPVGEIMAVRVGWQRGISAANQAFKALSNLAAIGKIEKHRGFFRMPGCTSDYGIHARLITQAVSEILICYPDSVIFREHSIPIGLRPDSICLLRQGQSAFCMVLEVMNNETQEEVERKIRAWEQWKEATSYLSSLFKVRIPHYEIITIEGGEKICAEKFPPYLE